MAFRLIMEAPLFLELILIDMKNLLKALVNLRFDLQLNLNSIFNKLLLLVVNF
jgi:hypothetical protein